MNSTASRVITFIVVVAVAGLLLASFLSGKRDAAVQSDVNETEPTTGMYVSESLGFSVGYPDGFSTADSENLPGVTFTAPLSLTAGTNLSEDTSFSVEVLEGATSCTASMFFDAPGVESRTAGDSDGRSWSYAESSDAGAGNRYDEKVYATGSGTRCYGLRSFVHSTNVGNYEPGTVEEFDAAGLDEMFAAFRASFRTSQ